MMVKVLAQRAGVEVERWRFARQRFIGYNGSLLQIISISAGYLI